MLKSEVAGPARGRKVRMIASYDAYDGGYIAPSFRFVEFDGQGLGDKRAIAKAKRLVRPHALEALWVVGGKELFRNGESLA